jgi:predicted phage terminase large subunit-like protein
VQLHPAQRDFCHSPALYRAILGGRGSGKSFAITYDLIRRARRGRLYMMVSPTYTILRDTDLRVFCSLARQFNVLGEVKISPPEVRLTTGAEILFRSADDPDRLRGPNLSGVTLNEASLMAEDVYTVCMGSLREGGERGWMSAGLTPKGLSHWTYQRFGRPQPDTAVFTCRTADNPFLPADFAATLAGQYTPQQQRQELHGEFVALEGAVWPQEYFPPSIVVPDAGWPREWRCCALALDPALGQGERGHATASGAVRAGCYAAFTFVGVSADGTLWVDAWMSQQWDAQQLVTKGLELLAATGAQAVVVETNAGQQYLAELFQAEARRRNIILPLYGINNSESKDVRVQAKLTPFLAQGRMRFRDSPGARLLVAQLREFPVSEYKDGPDSLQMAVVLVDWLLGQRPGGVVPRVVR